MSKEKQIEEITKLINTPCNDRPHDNCYEYGCLKCQAGLIYDAGYRKQSEGEWEKRVFIIFDTEKVGYRCSSCNTTWDTPTAYCPHCGAKMKGVKELNNG